MTDNTQSLPRHPAHPSPIQRHNESVLLHVTICAKERQPLLASEAAVRTMVHAWREATHWLVGWYLAMPDHVHFFCVPGIHEYPPVRRWAGFWKKVVGKIDPSLCRVFQEDCWDTQMRSREHYDEKLSYTHMNPVRAGLVKTPEEWPFQGKVHDVGWR